VTAVRGVRRPPLFVLTAIGAGVLFVIGFASAIAFENQDQNCAACHSEPETTYVGRLAAPAVDLASAHSASAAGTQAQSHAVPHARCIDCHAGPGPLGRVQSVSLGARNTLAWLSNQPRLPYAGAYPDGYCTQCHVDTEKTADFDLHSHRYLPDWRAQDPVNAATCASCHVSHTTGGNKQAGFLIQRQTQQQCEACHRVLVK
jgi:nitrate/TMAO reductase-like tetraheme cytochrome c subunit